VIRVIAWRVVHAFFVMLALTVGVFFLLHTVPGGPFDEVLSSASGTGATVEDIRRVEELLGLDRPWGPRYLDWLTGLVQGAWGVSWTIAFHQPVSMLIGQRIANTLWLTGLSTGLSLVIGLSLGIWLALHTGTRAERRVLGVLAALHSVPGFWLGLVLVAIFAVTLPVFPTGGAGRLGASLGERWTYLVLPVFTLVCVQVTGWARHMRAALLDVMGRTFMRVAAAKGLKPYQVVLRHGLPNAMVPILTLVALDLPFLISGATAVETVFNYPGMGLLLYDATRGSDWPVVQIAVVLIGLLIIVSNLVADLLQRMLDPRLREGQS